MLGHKKVTNHNKIALVKMTSLND